MKAKKTLLALFASGMLLPVAASAGSASSGRLEGDFGTRDATASVANEACLRLNGTEMAVAGRVTALSGFCEVTITYFSDAPNSVSASAITGSKTDGTGKVDQSVFTPILVEISNGEGVTCGDTYIGTGRPEKCKVSGSVKGTFPSTVQSSSAKLDCELEGALTPAPTTNEQNTIIDAFADRKDVKIDSKGKLSISHKGIPGSLGICDVLEPTPQ